jgi:hypothetical protein
VCPDYSSAQGRAAALRVVLVCSSRAVVPMVLVRLAARMVLVWVLMVLT